LAEINTAAQHSKLAEAQLRKEEELREEELSRASQADVKNI
jgi:hypothetical protein